MAVKGTLLVDHYGSRVRGVTIWRNGMHTGEQESYSVVREDYEYNAYNLAGRYDIILQHIVVDSTDVADAGTAYYTTVGCALANGYHKVDTKDKVYRTPTGPPKPCNPPGPLPPQDEWDLLEI